MELIEVCRTRILPIDRSIEPDVRKRLDSLTKPPGSLGRLEEMALQVCLMTGKIPPDFSRKRVVVMAADHGVAAEGVSAYPPEVTPQMVYNFLRGGAAINVLARHAGADVRVVDVGVNHDFAGADGLVSRKVRPGTANMAVGPAMSRGEARAAVEAGIEEAREAVSAGVTLLATGDMGIGNTTASSAVLSALTGEPPERTTGSGTGIDAGARRNKVAVIERALSVNRPDPSDPIDVLAKVGGLEIGAIAGLILGAAAERVPVVVDGFISTAGALIAASIEPAAVGYMIASHRSTERGHQIMLERLGLSPYLDLGLRLGEGTGAALTMGIVEASVRIMTEMDTFDRAGVSGRIPEA
ncbi:MAG: nicotinate-nucleotide--dimethylbenzimidazole phosphoribosyltransferase [Nitrospirota bacterium]